MRGRSVSAEATQYQVVFRVVPCIPDCYVLEQTNFCAQDIIDPGAHLPAALVHGPCDDVLQQRIFQWEEVVACFLQALLRHGRYNPIVPLSALWCVHVCVEISNHQQRNLPGPMDDGRDKVIYFWVVVWGQVAPHDKPLPVAWHQLKSDDVRPVDLERLHGEVLRRPVEHGNDVALCAWHLRCHHLVATRLTCVNTFVRLVSLNMPRFMFAWDIPCKTDSSPPFWMFRIMYIPKRIRCTTPCLSPRPPPV